MMTIDHETLKGVMERSPRKMSDRLLDRSLILKAFFWYGMLESLLVMIGFFVTYWTSQGHLNHLAASGSHYKEATTMTLGAIIFANKLITSGILLEIALFIAHTYTPSYKKSLTPFQLALLTGSISFSAHSSWSVWKKSD